MCFVLQFGDQMKAYCYRGSCRESVLSGHEKSAAIGLQLSVFNDSQMGKYLDLFFAAQTWHQMEAKSYKGSCRQLVLSGHENLEAIGVEVSVLNVSQKEITLVKVYSWICVSYHNLETRWKHIVIEVVVGNQFYLDMKVW